MLSMTIPMNSPVKPYSIGRYPRASDISASASDLSGVYTLSSPESLLLARIFSTIPLEMMLAVTIGGPDLLPVTVTGWKTSLYMPASVSSDIHGPAGLQGYLPPPRASDRTMASPSGCAPCPASYTCDLSPPDADGFFPGSLSFFLRKENIMSEVSASMLRYPVEV